MMQQCNIDLTELNFSSSTRSIRFYGRLVKNSGKELVVKEVENMIRALEGIPGITELNFDLENWKISAGSITPIGAKKKDGEEDSGEESNFDAGSGKEKKDDGEPQIGEIDINQFIRVKKKK